MAYLNNEKSTEVQRELPSRFNHHGFHWRAGMRSLRGNTIFLCIKNPRTLPILASITRDIQCDWFTADASVNYLTRMYPNFNSTVYAKYYYGF